jgi:hypothetical protein
MKTSKTVREIPTLTEWGEAVDSRNYAKGTDIEVVKDGGKNHATGTTYEHNKGAKPLFKYQNAKGNIGDWYALEDVTEVAKVVKIKNGAVKVTKPATEKEELTEFARIAKKYGIKV